MQILFITPSYEPGKDGVGDYTRRLVAAINRTENGSIHSKVIAWNDPFVSSITETNDSLRLPSWLKEEEKAKAAKRTIEAFNADWISLQWVPYGYHPKGLFLRQISSLKQAVAHHPLQLMVHETWIGAKIESTPKERLIGSLQRHLFKQLVTQLQPKVIHTQAMAYQYLLQQAGIHADLLPLFSNIIPTNPVRPKRSDSEIRVGFFGAIHPETNLDPLLPELIELGQQLSKPIRLLQAGRLNPGGVERFESWREQWADQIRFEALGEMDSPGISNYLYSLDLGLSTNPFTLTDKSGSVAAMLEHQLPVINLRHDVNFKGFTPKFDRIHVLDRPKTVELKAAIAQTSPRHNKPQIETIREILLASLKRAAR